MYRPRNCSVNQELLWALVADANPHVTVNIAPLLLAVMLTLAFEGFSGGERDTYQAEEGKSTAGISANNEINETLTSYSRNKERTG